MSKTAWYVHVDGENIGPFSTEKVTSMLQQNRFQFVDFIWAKHLTKWHRISDLDQFASLMPAYPKISIPENSSAEPPPPPKHEPKSEPAPKPVAAPKAEPAPVKKESPKKEPPKKEKEPEPFPSVRKFMRVPAKGEKVIVSDQSFTVINISEGGIFLKSAKPLSIGTEVKMELHIPGQEKELPMTGVVIRHGEVDKHAGFAIEFTRLNPAIKRILQQYVRAHSKEE
jgi:uncharacterized protein (TIGR02266 family)